MKNVNDSSTTKPHRPPTSLRKTKYSGTVTSADPM